MFTCSVYVLRMITCSVVWRIHSHPPAYPLARSPICAPAYCVCFCGVARARPFARLLQARCRDLSGIGTQLEKEGVKQLVSFLQVANSPYVRTFSTWAVLLPDTQVEEDGDDNHGFDPELAIMKKRDWASIRLAVGPVKDGKAYPTWTGRGACPVRFRETREALM